MTLFVQTNATGAGAGTVAPDQALVDLIVCVNGDTGIGTDPEVGNRRQVTYVRSDPGAPAIRVDALVNTAFTPDYGAGPQAVPIVIVPVGANFTLNNGRSILTVAGTALPPSNSGLGGATLNTTNDCLVIYDTTQNNGAGYCVARAGSGGTIDLQFPQPALLFHELSHAFRIVNDNLLVITGVCNPSSPEENAAIVDENQVRTQMAAATGDPAVLRDPGIHCGQSCATPPPPDCCIVASVASGSPISAEVGALRRVRDGLLRKSEVGFAFFQTLHRDYYAFSPQVCTLLARRPELRDLVLAGFVQPLVTMLGLIEASVLGGAGAIDLGERFLAEHEDREAAAERLTLLHRARDVLAGDDEGLADDLRELARLLSPALHSAHVTWALIEPIRAYEAALSATLEGAGAAALGEQLRDAVEEWAVALPLDDVWQSLSATELWEALAFLDTALLHTPEARRRFRHRLKTELAPVTAITALDDDPADEGGNR